MKTMKRAMITLAVLMFGVVSAQNCNCESNFEWVKTTFETNDAGFAYALEKKGQPAYEDHNQRFLNKAKSAQTIADCVSILHEWLQFFRSGHLGIDYTYPEQAISNNNTPTSFPNWETLKVDMKKFEKELNSKKEPDYEGVWQTGAYKIGIKKVNEEYIGFIIESQAETWTKDQVKLRFQISGKKAKSTFYMRDHSAVESESVMLIGKNYLQIGNSLLHRVYPKYETEKHIADYFKMVDSDLPYIDQLNDKTLYFRIPTFHHTAKKEIDSVIAANKEKILKTENLIIDIRDGTGGSDRSYYEILPFLYTNPIRTVGVEMYSTSLNNQRMLDYATNPDYGFTEEEQKWARESYEKLNNNLGKFVNLGDKENNIYIQEYDTIHPYPKNVGIIINHKNGSTDEQFLLAAKQSKKVKLFGTTTFGVLDISNMHNVESPCKEFTLWYSLSKSNRIPDFTIDDKGIQPDFYLDRAIPQHEWVNYVNQILNQ
jgi:hypothetical protein